MVCLSRRQGGGDDYEGRAPNRQQPAEKGWTATRLAETPIIFWAPILLEIALNRVVVAPFQAIGCSVARPLVTLCAVLLFLLSYREFRAAGTSVRGSTRTTAIVRTGSYRFSRNPIYLSFILLVLGLSVWLNGVWLLLTLVPAVGFISVVVIPREEQCLERIFHDRYSNYKATVRRWL
jgi:protein-S-isoprenylcysteine O-methyltransferase Ste14